jgi:predicted O-methyltransferase YrrM
MTARKIDLQNIPAPTRTPTMTSAKTPQGTTPAGTDFLPTMLERVGKIVGSTPHMTRDQAEQISTFILKNGVGDILELGFRHGVSTTYMAATLAGAGKGRIVTVDLQSAKQNTPNIEELLEAAGERARVDIYYEPTSYTWRLMRMLQEDPTPRFDMCYLDGAHDWFADGFAFFLVDRLLRPGGWIVFDDMDWTYAGSPTLRNTQMVKQMPEDERTSKQVRLVYDLLVKTHPAYHNFRDEGEWGFAQKLPRSASSGERVVVTESVVREKHVGLGGALIEFARALRGR